ncbi:NUBPL iron transfer P loop NTPase AAA domain [Trypanosoma vivax]|uniref:Cytosolic Fe-S cluster assembly factor NUBP1 homolog n=1 Tax=Trypanosoma vivax (strain Y486) TaxID=1055687 RepID=G0U5G7_TRYVY|nr:NUBPL iron transfer P loop NTPase AAA domain [Trypanosoma vivax]KAH8618452.1 NUBPL iron transfer P loop NTPase AAA domain [Trypanosoma vivax]CCC51117.1 putative nucleotide-binding protein [Trypanosoma vivax Y486]
MEGANSTCVGPESPEAGVAPSCQGCPNAALCASMPKGPDPDIELIGRRLSGVKSKVMVISGKGGVGKSTLTKELAFALGRHGLEVAVVDLDVCGPSIPRLAGVRGEDAHRSAAGIEPVMIDDSVCMISMHYLLESKNEAVLLRGPRKNGVVKMFFKDVVWGGIDIMLIDTPPGTSDEHITASSLLQQCGGVTGAILVTTPQLVAEADVRREVNFCQKAKIPILGIVENMSSFVCPGCGKSSVIFPSAGSCGAGERLSAEFGIPLWGKIPLDQRLMKACEEGVSLVNTCDEDTLTLKTLKLISAKLISAAGLE